MLSKTYSIYFETFKSFMRAVLMIEKSSVVYLAPSYEPDVIKTFRLITKGFTALSAMLFEISIYPDVR